MQCLNGFKLYRMHMVLILKFNVKSPQIRLLTGVGRYGEMLYIFHALQQHHQFELLLRKGMDRVGTECTLSEL